MLRNAVGSKKAADPEDAPVGDIVVASIPTLAFGINKRARNLKTFLSNWRTGHKNVLIVVDECHHCAAPTWRALLHALERRFPGNRLLGLSATPTRTAERERPILWHYFHRVIHEEPVLRLIHERVLAMPRIRLVETGVQEIADAASKRYFQQFHDFSPRF